MNLAIDNFNHLDNPTLTPDERASLRCRHAAEFIHTGQYEEARSALGDLWRGAGERPSLLGLKKETSAEVLLQCGVLSSSIGSARNLSGAQERAKDLISEALVLFESNNHSVRIAEAQCELGVCYWR